MKFKVFRIRLDLNQESDLRTIEEFTRSMYCWDVSTHFSPGEPPVWHLLVRYEQPVDSNFGVDASLDDKEKPPVKKKKEITTDNELDDRGKALLEVVRRWRSDKARELRIPSYLICTNDSLVQLVETMPASREELAKVKGFGPQKVSKHGDELLALLNS